jgi:hypothetical protein
MSSAPRSSSPRTAGVPSYLRPGHRGVPRRNPPGRLPRPRRSPRHQRHRPPRRYRPRRGPGPLLPHGHDRPAQRAGRRPHLGVRRFAVASSLDVYAGRTETCWHEELALPNAALPHLIIAFKKAVEPLTAHSLHGSGVQPFVIRIGPSGDRGDPAARHLQRLQRPAGDQPRVRRRPGGDHPRPAARPPARTPGRPRRRPPTSTPPGSPGPASRRPSTSPPRSPTTSCGAPTTPAEGSGVSPRRAACVGTRSGTGCWCRGTA